MSKIVFYTPTSSHGGMIPCANGTGSWATREDYEALAAEVERLRRENAALKTDANWVIAMGKITGSVGIEVGEETDPLVLAQMVIDHKRGRPLHQEPCEWEKKSNWSVKEDILDRADIEPGRYTSGRGCFNYCPMCGRKLGEK